MRIKEQFVLQEVADDFVVVPISREAERLHGVIKLNKSGACLWEHMSQKDATTEELESILTPERFIGRCPEQVERFLEKIRPLTEGHSGSDYEIKI